MIFREGKQGKDALVCVPKGFARTQSRPRTHRHSPYEYSHNSSQPHLPPLSKVRCCRPKKFGRLPEGLLYTYQPFHPHDPFKSTATPRPVIIQPNKTKSPPSFPQRALNIHKIYSVINISDAPPNISRESSADISWLSFLIRSHRSR